MENGSQHLRLREKTSSIMWAAHNLTIRCRNLWKRPVRTETQRLYL